jgi:hypothetical protein
VLIDDKFDAGMGHFQQIAEQTRYAHKQAAAPVQGVIECVDGIGLARCVTWMGLR